MNLRTRLLLAFLVLAALPIAVVGLTVGVSATRLAANQGRQALLGVAQALVDFVSSELEAQSNVLTRHAAELASRTGPEATAAMASSVRRSSTYRLAGSSPEVRILDAGQSTAVSFWPFMRGGQERWQPVQVPLAELPDVYRSLLATLGARAEPTIPVLTGAHSRGAVLVLPTRMPGTLQDVDRVVAAEYSLPDYLERTIARPEFRSLDRGFAAIRTPAIASWQLVFHPDPTLIGLGIDAAAPGVELDELVERIDSGSVAPGELAVARNGDELVALGLEPRSGMMVGATMSLSPLLAPVRRGVRSGLILLGLLVVLVVGGIFYATRGVGRAVGQIADTTAAMARGDFDRPLVLDRSDEFGTIARHVNRLSEELLISAESRAIARISAGLVHDLKGVASQLNLLLYNLREQPDDPEFRAECFDLMGDLVNQVEQLTLKLRRGAPQGDPRPQPVDLDALVRRLLDEPTVASRPGVHVETQLRASEPVETDPEQLGDVLRNVLANAVEAMEGRGELRVSTGSHFVEIADSGPGMSEAFVRDQLFRPFSTTKPKGTGLGMYTVRETITRLGGRIEVNSTEGQGTRVRIELPS